MFYIERTDIIYNKNYSKFALYCLNRLKLKSKFIDNKQEMNVGDIFNFPIFVF